MNSCTQARVNINDAPSGWVSSESIYPIFSLLRLFSIFFTLYSPLFVRQLFMLIDCLYLFFLIFLFSSFLISTPLSFCFRPFFFFLALYVLAADKAAVITIPVCYVYGEGEISCGCEVNKTKPS